MFASVGNVDVQIVLDSEYVGRQAMSNLQQQPEGTLGTISLAPGLFSHTWSTRNIETVRKSPYGFPLKNKFKNGRGKVVIRNSNAEEMLDA